MTEQTQTTELKVQWPASLKLHGTDELIYLQNHAACCVAMIQPWRIIYSMPSSTSSMSRK